MCKTVQALGFLLLTIAHPACDSPEATRVALSCSYDADWGLQQIEVAAIGQIDRVTANREIEVLVPDQWAGTAVVFEISGLVGEQRVAHGQVQVTPLAGRQTSAEVALVTPVTPGSCAEGCALGCDSMTDQCVVMAPSNLPSSICAQTGAASLVVNPSETRSINTDSDCSSVQSQGPLGPDICVVVYADIEIQGRLTAQGTRPLALVATGMMRVSGTVDGSANGRTRGPGAQDTGPGSGGTTSDHGSLAAGSGGAGHVTRGGTGGLGKYGSPGTGGGVYGAVDLVPLLAGSRGGGPNGGGGGGALELVGCISIEIWPTAVVDVGGGGGNGTSGGGSGGGILVEAPIVAIGGGARITANGGGGSSGAGPGEDATPAAEAAAGGPQGTYSGTGGDGGYLARVPGNGGQGTESGGGGGGSAGRIAVKSRAEHPPAITGVVFSPLPTVGAIEFR